MSPTGEDLLAISRLIRVLAKAHAGFLLHEQGLMMHMPFSAHWANSMLDLGVLRLHMQLTIAGCTGRLWSVDATDLQRQQGKEELLVWLQPRCTLG